jgi:Transposase IS116/IS110/IS902 family
MSRFASPEAPVSWAGLTPTASQSEPRKSRGKKGHGNTYAKRIVVLAAHAAANTDTFLGERFRRLASRPGGGGRKKAGCAVGRSILLIVWHLLTPPPATATSAPTGTPGTPTAAARRATPGASSRPSAMTSSSPCGRTTPDPGPSDNRIAVTAARAAHATGPSHRARNRGHASRLRWLFLGQTARFDPSGNLPEECHQQAALPRGTRGGHPGRTALRQLIPSLRRGLLEPAASSLDRHCGRAERRYRPPINGPDYSNWSRPVNVLV